MSSATLPASGEVPAAEPARPARLWPAVVLVAVYWTVFAVTGLADVTNFQRFITRFYALCGVALLFFIWWLTSRRLPVRDRFIVLGAAIACIAVVWLLLDASFNRLQLTVAFFALPAMFTAWTIWLVVTRAASRRFVRRGLIALAALAWVWALALRLDGLHGEGNPVFQWRWTPTAEQQFLAQRRAAAEERAPAADEPLVATDADWPEFRGPRRDGAVRGVKLAVDWNASPPKLLWKRRVGPGWSSIAVVGDRLFTQEQRGPMEAVVCFDADTGEEIWSHEDDSRFAEAMGGAGPRATPTFADGRLYTLGAKGVLNCLDAGTGKLHWSRDISKTDPSAAGKSQLPMWGFSSSPLVVDGKAIVFAGGGGAYAAPPEDASNGGEPENEDKKVGKQKGKGADEPRADTLLAYDAQSGKLAWRAPAGEHSYSSAQRAEIDGVQQVLFLGDNALQAFDPADGKLLWKLDSTAERSLPTLQPHRLADSRFLVSFNGDNGTVEAVVSHEDDKWDAKTNPQWTARDMKPFFNDFVRARGALFGFDGSFLCAIDDQTGKRHWKKRGYGSGQVLLVADQPLLVVISETGEAALVDANPEKHEELGRFKAIHGKTWNHPTIAKGRLYVRNAEEMACYELKLME